MAHMLALMFGGHLIRPVPGCLLLSFFRTASARCEWDATKLNRDSDKAAQVFRQLLDVLHGKGKRRNATGAITRNLLKAPSVIALESQKNRPEACGGSH